MTRLELLNELCRESGINRPNPARQVLSKREVTHILAFVKASKVDAPDQSR